MIRLLENTLCSISSCNRYDTSFANNCTKHVDDCPDYSLSRDTLSINILIKAIKDLNTDIAPSGVSWSICKADLTSGERLQTCQVKL